MEVTTSVVNCVAEPLPMLRAAAAKETIVATEKRILTEFRLASYFFRVAKNCWLGNEKSDLFAEEQTELVENRKNNECNRLR